MTILAITVFSLIIAIATYLIDDAAFKIEEVTGQSIDMIGLSK